MCAFVQIYPMLGATLIPVAIGYSMNMIYK